MNLPWQVVSVEIGLGLWMLAMLAIRVVSELKRPLHAWVFALCGTLLGGILLAQQAPGALPPFQGQAALDGPAFYFKALFLIITAFTVVIIRQYRVQNLAGNSMLYLLTLVSLLGMLTVSSATDLIVLFVGIEIVTFALYIMVAYMKTDKRAVEAGLKYLIMGSVASGMSIYGIAMLYGFAGGTGFATVQQALAAGAPPMAAYAGFLLLLAGIGFKFGIVPFHWWIPDVYEGAPPPVVALLSTGSKLTGMVALARVLFGMALPLAGWWMGLLGALAVLTICYGNLIALVQTNIKRLMGYSSIGHAGYLLLGLATGSMRGFEAVAYYAAAYLCSGLAVFMVITLVSAQEHDDSLEAYDGLAKRSPWLAAAMFLGLISLAGVPPTAGFFGKFLVLLAAVDARMIVLALIGSINVAISLYYYLGVVRRMYALEPRRSARIKPSFVASFALALLLAGILFLGLFQAPALEAISGSVGLGL